MRAMTAPPAGRRPDSAATQRQAARTASMMRSVALAGFAAVAHAQFQPPAGTVGGTRTIT